MKNKIEKPKLTPMQKFAIDVLKKKTSSVSPNYIASLWMEQRHGKFHPASRRRFGCTSAAYKTMRKLAEMGLVVADNKKERTAGGMRYEHYSLVKK